MKDKKVDISCPEKLYWGYVNKVAPVHDARGRFLLGAVKEGLQKLADCESILDVCGGTGRISKYLMELGHTVKLIDLSESMLAIARKKGINAELQDARHVEEDAGSYDASICLGNSIGGVFPRTNRLEVIKEMARVSKKYVLVDCINRLNHVNLFGWLPIYFRKLIGNYRHGIRMSKDVISGTNFGDTIWYDDTIDAFLYHYVYSVFELRNEMKQAGLKVTFVNHPFSRRCVLLGKRI